jgi:hypothetical protein
MKAPRHKSGKKDRMSLMMWGVSFLIIMGLGIYLINQVFRKPDTLSELCLEVLPQNKRVGLKMEYRDRQVTIDLSGQRGDKEGATPEQIEGFVKCIEITTKASVRIVNGVRLPLEPVGQVANRWRREPGVKLRLMPGSNNEALNNIRIGPATGLKEDIIREWCTQENAGACVICEPHNPTADTVEVLVWLRDNAPLEKRQLDGVWPAPQPGTQSEPWQSVNAKGERFYYECKGP